MIATESFSCEYDDRTVEITAGVTHVIDSHELVRRYPDRFRHEDWVADFRRPRSPRRPRFTSDGPTPDWVRRIQASRPTRPAARVRAKEPVNRVELREHGPRYTVALGFGVRRKIEDEIHRARADAGRFVESGGYLYSPWQNRPGDTHICHATGAGARGNEHSLQLRHSWDVDEMLARADFQCLGDWHTHSAGVRPSPADMSGWAGGLSRGRDARYVGLIVTPRDDGTGWMYPNITGWVVREVGDALVCEPASLKEE